MKYLLHIQNHFFVLLILFQISSKEDNIKPYPFFEAYLVIKGIGLQKLLNDSFSIEPSEVIVNSIFRPSCKKTCNL